MRLRTQMIREGRWLFRWRSYLPVLLLPVAALAIGEARHSPFHSSVIQHGWEAACILISVAGLMVRALAVGCAAEGTSGRNTRCQRAASLNTTGMYSIVRHPLYLGNCLVLEGFLLYLGVWWLGAVGALVFWLYYERIMLAEECYLEGQFGDVFITWAERTPAFVPHPWLWRRSGRALCMRRVIRNEYTTAMLVMTVFTALQAIEWAWVAPPGPHGWGVLLLLFAVSLGFYQAIRYIKKRTRLLATA